MYFKCHFTGNYVTGSTYQEKDSKTLFKKKESWYSQKINFQPNAILNRYAFDRDLDSVGDEVTKFCTRDSVALSYN